MSKKDAETLFWNLLKLNINNSEFENLFMNKSIEWIFRKHYHNNNKDTDKFLDAWEYIPFSKNDIIYLDDYLFLVGKIPDNDYHKCQEMLLELKKYLDNQMS